ncbi:hypothetical protein ABID08_002015 [Rhizobium binae]|uniref:Uncharacterized protein n=1 Tax=Rhizobium binae TaxID=1138190 RepID=A0ABV2MDW2_9HYPH
MWPMWGWLCANSFGRRATLVQINIHKAPMLVLRTPGSSLSAR